MHFCTIGSWRDITIPLSCLEAGKVWGKPASVAPISQHWHVLIEHRVPMHLSPSCACKPLQMIQNAAAHMDINQTKCPRLPLSTPSIGLEMLTFRTYSCKPLPNVLEWLELCAFCQKYPALHQNYSSFRNSVA